MPIGVDAALVAERVEVAGGRPVVDADHRAVGDQAADAAEVARAPRLGLGEGDEPLIIRQADDAELVVQPAVVVAVEAAGGVDERRSGDEAESGGADGELGGELHEVLLGVGCRCSCTPCSPRDPQTVQSPPGSVAAARRQSTMSSTAGRRSPRRQATASSLGARPSTGHAITPSRR